MLHRKARIERDRHYPPQSRGPIPAAGKEAGPVAYERPGHGWTTVLQRQPARIIDGRPEGGYSEAFELICRDCGDDPDLDYREVAPQFSADPWALPAPRGHRRIREARQAAPLVAGHRRAKPANYWAAPLPGGLGAPRRQLR